MNARVALLSVVFVSLAGQSAWAHENHPHHQTARAEIGEEGAKARAQQELERLVSIQKLEASWKQSGQLKGVEKKKTGRTWEWLATFENPTVVDKSKKVLYVFLKPTGEFVAANFTGK